MNYFLLVIGLALIIKSADILIDSVSKIAGRLGVSTFVIGITVVAFGTSAPELAVGIISGISHTNQLSLGNIIGSSFSNSAMIVGISAIIMPLAVKDSVIKREIPMLFFIQLFLGAAVLWDGVLSRIDGLILLAGFAAFMVYIIRDAKHSMPAHVDPKGDLDTDFDNNGLPDTPPEKQESMLRLVIFSILSLAGLFIGGRLTVNCSSAIAQSLGMGETLIGLTVVALATTMPELITSITAAIKKEPDIVLGNCIGSNIFNVLLVLGSSSVIYPIKPESSLTIDLALMIAITAVLFLISLARKKIRRPAGVILLISYVSYIAYKVISVL